MTDISLPQLLHLANTDPQYCEQLHTQLRERYHEALLQLDSCPELLIPLSFYGLINANSAETLIISAIREVNPRIITVIIRNLRWIDLKGFLDVYQKLAAVVLQAIPSEYRAPSILSVTDLLAYDFELYSVLLSVSSEQLDRLPMVRWNQDFDSLITVLTALGAQKDKRRKLQPFVFALARAMATTLARFTPNVPMLLDILCNPYGGSNLTTLKESLESRQVPVGPLADTITAILADPVLEARVRMALSVLE